MWQIDCESFRRIKKCFELRDVTTEEHVKFVVAFCERYKLKSSRTGSTVRFESA